MSEIILTDDNFKKEVLESELPVLVDFWAEWCGPCRMIGPIIKEIAEEFAGKLKVGKLNVDENSNTASEYKILSIPTLMIFKNGKIITTIVGAQPKDSLVRKINEVI